MNHDTARLRVLNLLWILILVAAVTIPLFISPHGREGFRVPKLAAFHAFGGIVAGVIGIATVFGWIGRDDYRRARAPLLLTALAIGWATLTAFLSDVPRISYESLVTVVSAAAFFVGAVLAAPIRPVRDLFFLTIGAVVNSLIVILQATKVWTPLDTSASGRLAIIGLLGNPNDVAMYLVVPLVVAGTLVIVGRGWVRRYAAFAALTLGIAMVMTQSVTGVAAAGIAGLLIFLTASRTPHPRRALVVAVGAGGLVGLFLGAGRLSRQFEMFEGGGLDSLLSGRMLAFTSAFEMIRAHPLFGVGPGMYSWHYFAFAPIAEERYGPFSYASPLPIFFAEAHNDHLQIAAETGLPGLFLFWASLGLLAWTTMKVSGHDARSEFATVAGIPLAVGLAVLALAQFPLRLPASLLLTVITFGACLAWSSPELEP